MRGKADGAPMLAPEIGITPAYAGKRTTHSINCPSCRDHPRVCGEKLGYEHQYIMQLGSPPRMRGKATVADVPAKSVGITPAYAGKSAVFGRRCDADDGSPPRMRGKVKSDSGKSAGNGITPAYAGKRLKRSRSTVSHVAIVPLFPSVCNKPVVSDGSPAGRDAPLFLPAENAVPASPAYNLRSL